MARQRLDSYGVRHGGGILAAVFFAVNASGCVPPTRFGPARDPSPWPAYLGTPRHDASAAESLRAAPQLVWTTDVGRAVRGSPAVGAQVLAVGLPERMLVLLERDGGAVLWRARLSGTVYAGPLLAGDRLYVATEETPEGRVYALQLRDGKVIWRARTGGVAAPLALDGATLYAALERGGVVALDAARGTVHWRRALPGAVRAAPVPTPAGLAVATTADSLFLLDPGTGGVIARRSTPGSVLATPALQDDRLYVTTASGRVAAYALPGLDVAWERSLPDQILGSPALAGDTLYALARDGTLALIPLDDVAAARTLALPAVAIAGPTPTRSGVLVATVRGEILLVDPASGGVRWRARVDGPVEHPPLVREGQLVVVGGRGDIHAYR
jgi:outer membrane protein assembly factor BamB